jgi:hypothetical protein
MRQILVKWAVHALAYMAIMGMLLAVLSQTGD